LSIETKQASLFDLEDDLAAEVLPKPTKQSRRKSTEVLPAVVPDDLHALARNLPPLLHLGTSSWSFAGWAGLVYGGEFSDTKLAREGLHAYAQHPLLRAVGIDRTFYAPIAQADYEKYAAQVPDDFRFLVKAPMAVTSPYVRDESGKFSNSPFFLDAAYAAEYFCDPCSAGLGAKLGVMVFQFPPLGSVIRNEVDGFINRLYRFLKALPPSMHYAVEVRDAALLTDRFYKALLHGGVQYCVGVHANLPTPAIQIERANAVLPIGAFIARWSLHSGFKYEDAKARYFPFTQLVDEDPDARNALCMAALRAIDAGFPVHIIANNKAEGSAPRTLAKLAKVIAAVSIPRPLKSA
jgi:uncharacterized protein YecE (DUF72 family)